MRREVIFIALAGHFFLNGFNLSAQDDYRVEKLPFSSRVFNDFAPAFYRDGIVFCSDRRTSILQGYVANEQNQAQLELFQTVRRDSAGWTSPEYFAKELNTIKFEGPVSFSPDGNMVYFTRNYDAVGRRNRKSGNPNYGIFISRYENGKWTTPESFVYNDPLYKVGHPSISPDGNKLYFASDQPGGYGGADLYVCTRENGSWSQPRNLGPVINSPADEMFPFIHRTGRLYFSSNRAGGKGKLDIYFSLPVGDTWLNPVLLPPPFNSPDDDFAYIVSDDFSNGFFTSSRNRTDNIFEFSSTILSMADCKPIEENRFTYEIFEPGTRDLDTLTYEYEWDLDQGVIERGRVVEHTFTPGTYQLKLNVVDTLTGAVMANVASYELEVDQIEQVYIQSPDTMMVGERAAFSSEGTYLPEWVIGNYFWNFGDGSGGASAQTQHIYQIPGVYNVQLIVESRATNAANRKRVCGTKEVVVLSGSREPSPQNTGSMGPD